MRMVAADTALIVVGAACGASILALVLIVVAPWRTVRKEPRLDPEVETRLLLGEDPDAVEPPGEEPAPPGTPVSDLHPEDEPAP